MAEKKKILYIVEAMGGGVFTYIVDLANELVNKYDMYIAYAVRKQTPKNYKDYFDKRIHLIEVKNFRRAIDPMKDIAAFFEVKKIAAEIKPDIIHLHSSKAGAIGRMAFNGKIPMFYTPHGYSFLMENYKPMKRRMFKLIESVCAKRNCTTISCSVGEHQESLKLTKHATYVNNGMVTSENYVLGYKASLIQGVTPGQIRERMEKLNPDRFRVRKFGVSDVIVTSIGGKTQSYYVNPKELIKFNGFFTKLPNGEYLLLNEEGYQVEGQKGTWTVTDEKTIDEQRFVLMVSDQKPDLLPSIVVQSDGKFITSTASGFDNATVRKIRELLHHEKFLENGTAERARESGTEQNYNMIDGCVNNVPKKPRVIGGRVSVLDRLHIKQAERARKDNAQVQQQERTRKT